MDEATMRPDSDLPGDRMGGPSPTDEAPSHGVAPSATRGAADRPSRLPRTGFQVLALGALAIALIMAFVSANSIMAIWFEARYVPIVRLAFAVAVGGVAIWVILRLAEKKA